MCVLLLVLIHLPRHHQTKYKTLSLHPTILIILHTLPTDMTIKLKVFREYLYSIRHNSTQY